MSTRPVERHRNWAVYILVLVAIIAGILAFLDAARYMGWLPITQTVPGLGEIKFVIPNAQWFAALMSALVGVIWFVVAWWLWTLNPSGWLFVIIIAIFNLILLLLAVLGKTTFNQILPALLVNAVALILALLPGTKAAFTPARPSPQAAAAAGAAAAQRAATAVPPPPAAPKAAAPVAAAPVAAAPVAAAPVAPKAPPVPQDLTKIEGIGPKVAAALSAAGITTYAELAATPADQLRKILADAGISADPATWPEQAKLAAAGKWDDLQAWQDKLQGGRLPQDLTKIEGIGPKIAAALSAAGITTYAELVATPVDQLRKILADAGISADPATWPEQARLAAAGKWDDLQAWQDKLQGGR